MTTLYTTSCEALAEAINVWRDSLNATHSYVVPLSQYLIDSGVVRIIDPDAPPRLLPVVGEKR